MELRELGQEGDDEGGEVDEEVRRVVLGVEAAQEEPANTEQRE